MIGETDPDLVAVIRAVADEAGAGEIWVRGEEFDCTANRVAVGRPAGRPAHPGRRLRRAAGAAARRLTRASTPPAPWPRPRRSSARRWTRRWWRTGSPPLPCPAGWRWSAAGRSAWWTAPTTSPAWRRWPTPLIEEFGGRRAQGVAVVGMLGGRDPSAMLAPLRSAGVETVVACAPDSPRALSAEVVAEAARALGLRWRWPARWPRRWSWPARWCPTTACCSWPAPSTWWPTPGALVVGRAPHLTHHHWAGQTTPPGWGWGPHLPRTGLGCPGGADNTARVLRS